MIRQTRVENGEVRGLPGADPRVTVYRGIPFAAPPVGENRWRAPQPCENWDGIREAYAFGPISWQDTPGLGTDVYCREWHVDPEIPMSEDCLYLNVWTPAKKTDEKLPVFVWFFGGGYQWGYTAEMEFDGERLARRGVVVVSVAYRLNVFGFLAHPELTKESPDHPSNFGMLDQQAGLNWVHRNIAAFGGDPEHITIGGQSAGGGSVLQQMTCEQNFALIKGAVIFSGMMRAKDDKDTIFRPLDLKGGETLGEEFFRHAGLSSLAEARKLSSAEIFAKYNDFVAGHARMFPIRDGGFCVGDPIERFVAGDRAPVPVFAGNTSDEFLSPDGFNIVEHSVKSTFLDAREHGDRQSLYYYRFDPDMPGSDHPGNFHSVDLWFFFESLHKCWRPFTGRHFELARTMADQLANFIKTGNPNGPGWDGEPLPVWPAFEKDNRFEMNYLANGAVCKAEGGIRLGDTGRKQAVNPYLPEWEFIPDGEPYVFGDRVYVYGSHDEDKGEVFCTGDYVCWSAPVTDLGNWHYEGVTYRKTQDPLNPDGHMCLYAPDVTVGPDGRYYLYYVLDKVSVVSVAVCDTPAGQYEFLGYVHYPDGTRLGDRDGDEPQFDPGVLTEGDTTFLFTGFCGRGDKSRHGAMFTVLEKDMLTIKTAPVIVVPGSEYSAGTEFEGHAFFEAPSIRKKDGKYFFIYSSEVMRELCYAVSDTPGGPYRYGGVLIDNCDIGIDTDKPADQAMACGANNHGSMVQIGADWYIFYHRHTNGTWYSRQGCAEKLSFRPDGSVIQAELTSCGLNNGPLCDRGEYPAYLACHLYSEKHTMYVTETEPKIVQEAGGDHMGSYIHGMSDGCTAGFKYFAMEQVTGIRIRTKGYHNGCMEVRTSWNGEVLGKIDLVNSNIWKADDCRFPAISGTHALYLTYRGGGSVNLKSVELLH